MIILIKTYKNLTQLKNLVKTQLDLKKLEIFLVLSYSSNLNSKKISTSSLNSKLKLNSTQNFELKTRIGLNYFNEV